MRALTTLLLSLTLSSPLWAADIQVTAPYARAVPPGQPNSAVFMELENRGDETVTLTEASSDAAKVVELHTHIEDQGVMRMRRIDGIELPAHRKVSLQPGGLHVMLIGLNRDLAEGDRLLMTLGFSDGSQQTLELPVQPVMPMGHRHHGSGMGQGQP